MDSGAPRSPGNKLSGLIDKKLLAKFGNGLLGLEMEIFYGFRSACPAMNWSGWQIKASPTKSSPDVGEISAVATISGGVRITFSDGGNVDMSLVEKFRNAERNLLDVTGYGSDYIEITGLQSHHIIIDLDEIYTFDEALNFLEEK